MRCAAYNTACKEEEQFFGTGLLERVSAMVVSLSSAFDYGATKIA